MAIVPEDTLECEEETEILAAPSGLLSRGGRIALRAILPNAISGGGGGG